MKKAIMVASLAVVLASLGYEAARAMPYEAARALPLNSITKASAPTLEDQIAQVRVKKGSTRPTAKPAKPSRPIAGKPGKPSHPIAGKPGKPSRPIAGKPGKPSHPIAGKPGKPHRPVAGRPGVGHIHQSWTGRYWSHGSWITGSIVAIGVLNAAAAAAYAPPPPGSGYCWYYSDPSYTVGYWALCE